MQPMPRAADTRAAAFASEASRTTDATIMQLGGADAHMAAPLCTQCLSHACLLYTSDAADEEDSVDLGGRRIIKK